MPDLLQTEKKTVAFGASFSMFGYALSLILGILTNVLMYQRLDLNSEVNVWVIAFSFFAILEPFARLGLSDGVQRFIGMAMVEKNMAKVRGVILGSFQLSTIASLLMIGGVWAAGAWFVNTFYANVPEKALLANTIRCLSFYLLPIALTTISLAVLRALNDIRHSVWVETLCQKFGWFLVVLAVSFLPPEHNRVLYLVWGMVFVTFVAFICSLRFHTVSAPRLKQASPEYHRLELLGFSLPLVLQSAILVFMKRCDIMMLGAYAEGNEGALAAQYNAMGVATLIIANILVAFSSLFAPLIAKVSAKKDYAAMNELYQTVTRWMLYMTLPAAALMFFFPELVTAVFKCQPTPELVWTLRILVLAQVVSTMAGHSGTMLIMSGYSRLTLYINILAVAANIGLNLFLIPRYSMIGAALATMAAIAIRNLLAVAFTKRLLYSQPFSLSTLTIFCVSTISVLFSRLIFNAIEHFIPDDGVMTKLEWILQIIAVGIIFAGIYGPITIATMHKDDRKFLKDIIVPNMKRIKEILFPSKG